MSRKTKRKDKWALKADKRRELQAQLPKTPQFWQYERKLSELMQKAEMEALRAFVTAFPKLTRSQVVGFLELEDVARAGGLVEDLLLELQGPIGLAVAPPKPPKAPAKKASKKSTKAAPAKSKAKSKPKAPAAKPTAAKPKTPRKSTADRILEVLEAERPSSVAKPTLRKRLSNVSGGGLDKAIAKLLADGRIVGSDPYSLAGVVDESKGPLFGDEAAE